MIAKLNLMEINTGFQQQIAPKHPLLRIKWSIYANRKVILKTLVLQFYHEL